MKILWKEWRQQRLIFGLGCALGIFFPLLEALNHWRRFSELHSGMGGGIILGFGALFALILATATTYDDVRRGATDFWQSRPVPPRDLLIVKFLAGAFLLGIAFLVTGSIDFVTDYGHYYRGFAWNAFTLTWPIAVMIFAAAMFFTVIIRDAAKAVLLAIWIALLIYFLPLLVSGLHWFNIFERIETHGRNESVVLAVVEFAKDRLIHLLGSVPIPHRVPAFSQYIWSIVHQPEYLRYLIFLSANLIAAVAGLVLSIQAVKRRWRWNPGQETIVWTLGLFGAFIFALAMFQVGHNLSPLTSYEGKNISPTVNFYSPAEKTYDWADPKTAGPMVITPPAYSWVTSGLSVHADLLFKATIIPESQERDYSKPIRHNWVLDVYRYALPEGKGRHLATVRFFIGSKVPGNRSQSIVDCFWANDRLYVVYAPQYLVSEKERPSARARRGDRPVDYYAALRLLVADMRDPAHPGFVNNREFYRPRLFGVQREEGTGRYGSYCYIGLADELLVVSLANPDLPQIIRKIEKSEFGLAKDTIPNVRLNVTGNKLLCVGEDRIMILDLTQPQNPKKIFYRKFELEGGRYETGIKAAALAGDFIYISRNAGIEVCNMSGKLVGRRATTPLEQLAGRRPHALMVYQNKLFEAAGGFGVLVYDVSDPTRPQRLYHGGDLEFVSAIGLWNGLFYIADAGHASYRSGFGELVFLNVKPH